MGVGIQNKNMSVAKDIKQGSENFPTLHSFNFLFHDWNNFSWYNDFLFKKGVQDIHCGAFSQFILSNPWLCISLPFNI